MTPGEFTEVFDEIAEAPGGIERLRELVLQLAVRGRLVPQDANEESASVLLERIADEKFRLFREGKLRIPKPVPPIATDEAPFDAPDQWEWVRLGNIANSRLGKMLDKSKNKGSYRRYLRNANVQWFRFDLSDVLELRLEDAELEEYSVKENDLIVCEGGEPGRAAVCGPDVDGMVFQKALHRVRPWCGISTWYLAYLLRCDTWSQRIDAIFTGATIKHLTGKALATHMVPLPPLSEQYRIVAKIDELMGLIDRLEAARRSREDCRTAARDSALAALRNAAIPEEVGTAWTRIAERMDELFTAPADLVTLREAVLQLAVRGRLVPQEADEEPASQLLEAVIEEKANLVKDKKLRRRKPDGPLMSDEIPFEIPQSWVWARLHDLAHDLGQKVPDETFSYIDVSVVDNKRGLIPSEVPVLDPSAAPSRARKLVSPGSVIYSTVRPYLLNIAVIEREYSPMPIASTAFAVLHPYSGVHSRLLFFYLRSPFFIDFVTAQMKGVAYPAISDTDLLRAPVPLPPAAEQHRIVAKLHDLMTLIDRLAQHLHKKKVCHEAFTAAAANAILKT